jgi:hypothetical protein
MIRNPADLEEKIACSALAFSTLTEYLESLAIAVICDLRSSMLFFCSVACMTGNSSLLAHRISDLFHVSSLFHTSKRNSVDSVKRDGQKLNIPNLYLISHSRFMRPP